MDAKGKPVTTSVPTISIKFHANAEHIEELYASDEEHGGSERTSGSQGLGESDSSPLKYLPRLVKRSTSIDITPGTTLDASPPSDPWRFFSDIKGKITKSVEEKITEIKSRNQEEGSPLKSRQVKDSKDNSSVSDSEDLSESSISKTCGIVSTTEGAEMSSDDDTPSIEKDKKTEAKLTTAPSVTSSGLRQRFRLLKSKSAKEGTISKRSLATLYNINADKIEQALPEENDIESAVDALEEQQESNEKVLKAIEDQFDNVKVDADDVVTVREIPGSEMRDLRTVYAPVGFVDLRTPPTDVKSGLFWPAIGFVAFLGVYVYIHRSSSYLAGFMMGGLVIYAFYYVKSLLETPSSPAVRSSQQEILEVHAVREFQPLTKYEGWVNEFPETYNPHTYHISQTQSIFLRLQGNLLRASHTRSKVPKRALWNEPKIKPAFTHHRVYNLLGAQIALLPEGLAKKRHWSKKYPICLTLSKDQMEFETSSALVGSLAGRADEDEESSVSSVRDTKRRKFGRLLKKKRSQTLRFSKLSEENEEFDLDSENSRASSPSPLSQDDSESRLLDEDSRKLLDETLSDSLRKEDDNDVFDDEFDALPEDWGNLTLPDDDSPSGTKLYLFGRTDREKEDWFRRLTAATHRGATLSDSSIEMSAPNSLLEKSMNETDYIKYMSIFNKVSKAAKNDSSESSDDTPPSDIQWLNAFVGRVLFDCFRDDNFSQSIRDRIQRKLSSIKLPYFIEGLVVTELTLGRTPPLIHKVGKPLVDERGLWIDLDVTYEGLVVLILQTKLNLMKLKQPPVNDCTKETERSAMFNSDVEDSAESTSDEEAISLFQNPPVLDSSGVPLQGVGGSSTTSKKFMKMVDRIAESKFFQAATEYRYIKKAMEGVSNTDLRLKVEVKRLVGTLVLNVPPPPNDRVWIGFRPTPELALSAQPNVGERNITFLRITSWIEKKLVLEFQKLMVIPNMEDFIVPVMSPKLPE